MDVAAYMRCEQRAAAAMHMAFKSWETNQWPGKLLVEACMVSM